MKKIFTFMCLLLIMASCATPKTFNLSERNPNGETVVYDEVEIEPYGIFNTGEKVPGIKYRVHPGTVILSVIFSETIVVPAILCGWFLWEPKKVTDPKLVKR